MLVTIKSKTKKISKNQQRIKVKDKSQKSESIKIRNKKRSQKLFTGPAFYILTKSKIKSKAKVKNKSI